MQPLPKSKSISLYLQFILVGLPMEWLLFLQQLERYFSILTSPNFQLHALQPYTQICWSIHRPICWSLCWSIHHFQSIHHTSLFDVFVFSSTLTLIVTNQVVPIGTGFVNHDMLIFMAVWSILNLVAIYLILRYQVLEAKILPAYFFFLGGGI